MRLLSGKAVRARVRADRLASNCTCDDESGDEQRQRHTRWRLLGKHGLWPKGVGKRFGRSRPFWRQDDDGRRRFIW